MNIFIGLLKTILEHFWPVVVLILSVFFGGQIRGVFGAFKSLIDRTTFTKAIGKYGDASVELQADPPAQSKELQAEDSQTGLTPSTAVHDPMTDEPNSSPLQSVLPTISSAAELQVRERIKNWGLNSPTVQLRVRLIANDLETYGFERNTDETTDILIRQLAAQQTIALAEKTYRLLFGSQLLALKHLNVYGPMSIEEIEKIYDQAAKTNPDLYQKYSFEQWLSFTQHFWLIETVENICRISASGKEFLSWIVEQGLPENLIG